MGAGTVELVTIRGVRLGKRDLALAAGLAALCLGLGGCAEPARPAPGEVGPVFSPDSSTVRVAAGAHYARRGWLWQRLWGRHYRPLWATPVSAPVLRLGQLGLTPLRAGGSFQTNTLRLRTPDGRVFVLRSVDKNLSRSASAACNAMSVPVAASVSVPAATAPGVRKSTATRLLSTMIISGYRIPIHLSCVRAS